MHITNLPLVGSSLTFLLPYYLAISYENYISATAWGALTCTSTLVHITKQPFHLYGPGNCIPWLYTLDLFVLYGCIGRSIIDAWYGGPLGIGIALSFIFYAGTAFYYGENSKRFVYDKRVHISILSHMSVHIVTTLSAIGVLTLRQLNLRM
jgi:hypothetical protein